MKRETPGSGARGLKLGSAIALGTGIGAALGVVFGQIAIGAGLGAAIGVVVGAILEQQRRNDGDGTNDGTG